MRIGYARTSTSNQKYSLENQIEKLTQNGCEKIFSEEISSVSAKRPAFDSAIEFARDGDTLIVTTLSRFARSISDVVVQFLCRMMIDLMCLLRVFKFVLQHRLKKHYDNGPNHFG